MKIPISVEPPNKYCLINDELSGLKIGPKTHFTKTWT